MSDLKERIERFRKNPMPDNSKLKQLLADCMTRIEELEKLVRDAQHILRDYLPPDSGISEHKCVNQMLGLFDGPECRKVLPNE